MKPVRCPYCNKLLAEGLLGILYILCPRCKVTVRIDRIPAPDVPLKL